MKRGQIFSTDFIFALLIMTAALLTLVIFKPWSVDRQPEELIRTEALLTEGVPSNWNETTVITPGLLTGITLNRTKIDLFEAMTDQERTQRLGLTRPIAVRIEHEGTILCQTCGTEPVNPSNLRVIRRFALLDGTMARITIAVSS